MTISGRILLPYNSCNKTLDIDFQYSDGIITLFYYSFFKECRSLEGYDYLIGCNQENSQLILFHPSVPLTNIEYLITPMSKKISMKVDWFIENYHSNAIYRGMDFDFPELGYFFYSGGKAKFEDNSYVFKLDSSEIYYFYLKILERECKVRFFTEGLGGDNGNYVSAQTHTTLNVQFEPFSIAFELISSHTLPDEFNFFIAVRQIVHNTFAFICNRKNITPNPIRLGESQLTCINHYVQPPEDIKTIENGTPWFNYYGHRIEKLFKMVTEDYAHFRQLNFPAEANPEYTPQISISSLQESTRLRKYIDLSQTLRITAAFEFYVRTYLPNMRSSLPQEDKNLISKLENLLDNYTGETKKRLKEAIKSLKSPREPSLSEKVKKVYEGYDTWQSLERILKDFPIGAKDISGIATEINSLRNELAHEKREYQLSPTTVDAVRLVERLNYCIVLREIGCCENQITEILIKTFPHEYRPPEPDLAEI